MKPIDYKIVRADSSPELESAVKQQIKLGYTPQGGIYAENGVWYQAMIYQETA